AAEKQLHQRSSECGQLMNGPDLGPDHGRRVTVPGEGGAGQLVLSATGRVPTPVGAIQIESPVRRKQGELFDFDAMQKVCAMARENQIGLHLDGARIFLASAYTGISPAQYASLFDTVYVSLYKYFNAASGAILAGPKRLLDGLYHTRRQFGG